MGGWRRDVEAVAERSANTARRPSHVAFGKTDSRRSNQAAHERGVVEHLGHDITGRLSALDLDGNEVPVRNE